MRPNHTVSVPTAAPARPNQGGRPPLPAVVSANGYAEMIATIRNEIDAIEQWTGILRLVGEQLIARRIRLERVVLPEVLAGSHAAETVVAIDTARRARRRIVASSVRFVGQVAA